MNQLLIPLHISILCIIFLVSKKSSAAHYQYESCLVPRNCTNGPAITFPFYITPLQESYCGFPGFGLNCTENGYPVLHFPENDFIIEDIFYHNRSLKVYNAAVLGLNSSSCVPRIRNTTLPSAQFGLVRDDQTRLLHLFSNCTEQFVNEGMLMNRVENCDVGDRNWDLGFFDDDESLRGAIENCERNVFSPVERRVGDNNFVEVLRRGFMMNWIASDCHTCEESGGRCGFNETTYHFRCFCPDRPHSRSCKPEKGRRTLKLAAGAAGGGLFLLCLVIPCLIWQHKKRKNSAYLVSRNVSSDPSSKSDLECGSFYYGIPIFSYSELEKVTNNFDSSKELGDGGFGTVYYGKLKDGREVAIKRLYEHNCKRVEQFMNEIQILTCLKHKNLVNLYGCTSRRSRELLLVYEYIPNGTVADHLHGERAKEAPLTWHVRLNIAIETASALAYLHKSDIVHRDVKTNNILLDNNFCVKVADFGLSRLFPNDVTHISTAPQGTPGYVDPEYHQCYQLTDKSDVYSFGVVLIELVSSMPAVDINRHRHEINLANMAVNLIQRCAFDELIDSSLGYKLDSEITRMTTTVAELAFRCLQLEKDMRPSMDEVLDFLVEIQNGVGFENRAKIQVSPENDDVVLLKNKYFQSSPNAVTDKWTSGSTTTSSIG
ncbi:hypothetical protein RD792_011438 [Penstemon davidsonii]|uniref:non-specific serine/threonine protein kinase n=1 Tax=Penstemon davidsonii TaxID=160366 RepID=A0ABR0D4L3_9LAMI|nr:hypothetical protein RD792_011438 [Penstemon davidsonii]